MTNLRIADMPLDEQPRERLARHGVGTLSDAELLALLLVSGSRGRNALQVARSVLADGLRVAAQREWLAHRRIAGIGNAQAAKIAAAMEFGRRISASGESNNGDPVRDPESLARRLIARYAHHTQERLGAVFLNSKGRVIREREIYIGTLNSATVSTRDVLRYALDDNAASVIVFHNHPSGDPSPSSEDLLFTRKLVEAGKVLGVDVVDHLILGTNRFVSLKQRGAM